MASVLFSPITLRGLTLPNRVVVSPMCQYNSNNGSANDWHLMHLGNMSLGCAGLVMLRDDQRQSARAHPRRNAPACIRRKREAALKRVLYDFCRTYGVAKLGVQLAHAGRESRPRRRRPAANRSLKGRTHGRRRRRRRCPTTPAGRCRTP